MLTTTLPMAQLLKQWQQAKLITALDRHFALELANIENMAASSVMPTSDINSVDNTDPVDQVDSDLLLLICTLLSQQLSNQHSCLVLHNIVLTNPMAEDIGSHPFAVSAEASCQITVDHNQLNEQLSQLNAIGQPGDNTPMIIEFNRLYLNKYYVFETQVALKLRQLASINILADNPLLPGYLDDLFPPQIHNSHQFDWQKIATATALTKALAVITGGPGTGKTTTVTKLLLLLLTQQSMTIRLVAPTGKAAARLSESIKASKNRLRQSLTANQQPQALLTALEAIPEEAATLHRLLGVIPHSHQFRHNKDNPLRLDLLVIDEASMVDLPMMNKILSALPDNARLILLGDQDQLASVEAGAVLADICQGLKQTAQNAKADINVGINADQTNLAPWRMHYSQQQADNIKRLTGQDVSQFIDTLDDNNTQNNSDTHNTNSQFGDSLCMLMHSHRFKGDAGIGQLANAVNDANVSHIRQVWQHGYAELNWFEHQTHSNKISANQISANQDNAGKQQLLALSVSAYQPYLDMIHFNQNVFNNNVANTPVYGAEQIIEQYNQYRMLCAMRASEYGVDGMNIAITDSLRQAQLIQPKQEFYLGRPIIVQNNDYNLGLFNGDIGLILQDQQNPARLMAHFIQADGNLLKVLPARLPKHDTCFAMTVHKSQGSEFDQVSFVLPPRPSVAQWQLLTKELVYTAITRAKNHFYCLGSATVFERAAKQVTTRASGLALRLWAPEANTELNAEIKTEAS